MKGISECRSCGHSLNVHNGGAFWTKEGPACQSAMESGCGCKGYVISDIDLAMAIRALVDEARVTRRNLDAVDKAFSKHATQSNHKWK